MNTAEASKDLASHMAAGLIDRWLEFGYVNLLSRFAKEGTPFYVRCDGDKTDRVTVAVEELSKETPEHVFIITRQNHNPDEWYKIRVRLDYHFRVLGVVVESPNYTTLEVATNLHGVITSAMCGYCWNGDRYSVQEITDARTLCSI
jgi:hypothetical protein